MLSRCQKHLSKMTERHTPFSHSFETCGNAETSVVVPLLPFWTPQQWILETKFFDKARFYWKERKVEVSGMVPFSFSVLESTLKIEMNIFSSLWRLPLSSSWIIFALAYDWDLNNLSVCVTPWCPATHPRPSCPCSEENAPEQSCEDLRCYSEQSALTSTSILALQQPQ